MLALQESTRTDDVLGLLSSLRNPPPTSAEISKSTEPAYKSFHREEAAFRHRQLRLSRFRALSLTVREEEREESGLGHAQTYSGARASPTGAQSCSIPIEAFSHVEVDTAVRNPPRSAAVYKKMSVWVEWKYYHHGVGDVPEPSRQVKRRVDGLAKLLGDESKPDEFRVPQCLGYVHDVNHGRFGFVFKGRGTPRPLLPLSLRSLLGTGAKKPSLSKRMAIARGLVTAVWYLHATDWPHGGIRSENVIFNDEAEFASPMPLLCGFEYSHPAGLDDVSATDLQHDLYRRPKAQVRFSDDLPNGGTRVSRKILDVYSLGVVLFEIGAWQPVDQVLGLYSRTTDQVDIQVARRKLLADEAMELLEAETGAIYAGVVGTCLEGKFGGEGLDDNVLVEFGERVVSILSDVIV